MTQDLTDALKNVDLRKNEHYKTNCIYEAITNDFIIDFDSISCLITEKLI